MAHIAHDFNRGFRAILIMGLERFELWVWIDFNRGFEGFRLWE